MSVTEHECGCGETFAAPGTVHGQPAGLWQLLEHQSTNQCTREYEMTEKTLPPLTADDMKMLWDNGKTYPFVESENCTVMGYGHPDRAEFAALVSDYDRAAGWDDGEDSTAADDVSQLWAVRVPNPSGAEEADGWWMRWSDVTAETPGAFPVSIVQR